MGSSFLTVLHSALAIFAGMAFLKLIFQYGRPRHPLKVIAYLTTFAGFAYFLGDALADLGFISGWDWVKWQTLPVVACSLGLIFEIIMIIGSFNTLQLKIMTRLPLLGSLLGYTFLKEQTFLIAQIAILISLILLIISSKNVTFFKRVYIKMTLMLGFSQLLLHFAPWGMQWLRAIVLFFVFFYFYLLQQGIAANALIESLRDQMEEEK